MVFLPQQSRQPPTAHHSGLIKRRCHTHGATIDIPLYRLSQTLLAPTSESTRPMCAYSIHLHIGGPEIP